MTHFSKHEVINNLRRKVHKLEERLKAVQEWGLLFNQCIDSEAAKEKLEKILKGETDE